MTSQAGVGSCYNVSLTSTGSSSSASASGSTSSSANTIAIVLGVALGLLVVGIAVAFGIYWRRKYKRHDVEMLQMVAWAQIDNVKILDRLGGGNFGEVFRALWNGTTDVALKQLKSKEHFEEFLHETNMLHALNHPNVVHFFGVHTTSKGENFIVMEYLSEGSLDRVLQMNKEMIGLEDVIGM